MIVSGVPIWKIRAPRREVPALPASAEGKGGIHGHSEVLEQKTGQNIAASEAAE